MAYQYDVFLSYHRNKLTSDWLITIFYPLLEDLLPEVIQRKARIFRDTSGVQGGQDWEMRIKRALSESRIIMPVFTPMYFQSAICVKELAVFMHRQHKLGYQTLENPDGLILPVRTFDGDTFPPYVERIQFLDCNDHNRDGLSFKNTESYQIMQQKIHEWLPGVGRMIDGAPAFNADWINDEWLNQPYAAANVIPLDLANHPPRL